MTRLRASVRPVVTFGVSGVYLALATYIVVNVLQPVPAGATRDVETPLAVLAGVAGVAGTTVGYWFASRPSQTTSTLTQDGVSSDGVLG